MTLCSDAKDTRDKDDSSFLKKELGLTYWSVPVNKIVKKHS